MTTVVYHLEHTVKGLDDSTKMLGIYSTREEAENIERFLVNENFIGRSDTYNITLGGDTPPLLNKIIYQYSLSGNYLRSFNSIKEASNYVHIHESALPWDPPLVQVL